MLFFKKKITEAAAAGAVIVSVFKYLENDELHAEFEKYNNTVGRPLGFEIADFDEAETDYRAAVLAVETQALPNIFPKDQAERLRAYTLAALKEMSPSGCLIEKYQEYEHVHLCAVRACLNPIVSVAEVLMFNWAGFGDPTIPATVSSSPFCGSYVSMMMLSGAGRWKRLLDSYKLRL